MLEYILVGSGLAFVASVHPGPLQAFLLSRVATVGWRRTLPAALAPILSDGPIAVIVLTVLHRFAHGFEGFLRGVGGIVLMYFAAKTFLEWRRSRSGTAVASQAAPRTLPQAVLVNVLNPAPYLGWSLILGPLAIEAWARAPMNAVALVVSFYLVMTAGLAVFITLLGTTSFLGPRGRQGLLLAAAFALAGLGVYSFYAMLR